MKTIRVTNFYQFGYVDYPAGKLAGPRFNFSNKFENWLDANTSGNVEIGEYLDCEPYIDLLFEKDEDHMLFVLTYEHNNN